ncbi:hypothetical protein Hanom_Chr09g00819831 [Helianthus anomalus]
MKTVVVVQSQASPTQTRLGPARYIRKAFFGNPFFRELITVFVPVVCQKSLFQFISLKITISVSVVSLS